jgi:serine protease Do
LFRTRIAQTLPGTKVSLDVFRAGKPKTFAVAIAEQPESLAMGNGQGVDVGIELSDLSPELRGRYEVPASANGAVVVNVLPGSVGDRAGLRTGMVIAEIDRRPIRSATEAKKALAKDALQRGVLLLVRDNDGSRFVVLSDQ